MKNFVMAVLFFAMGCAHTLDVPGNSVSVSEQIQKKACLVLTPEFRNYLFEKEAYNWAGGSMFPDKLTFTLGKTLAGDLANLCEGLYMSVSYADSLDQAKDADVIILPEIDDVILDLPAVRFADIASEIGIRYSFYNSDMKKTDTKKIIGKGVKKLTLSKENYTVAFQEAMKDLLLKTKIMMESSS